VVKVARSIVSIVGTTLTGCSLISTIIRCINSCIFLKVTNNHTVGAQIHITVSNRDLNVTVIAVGIAQRSGISTGCQRRNGKYAICAGGSHNFPIDQHITTDDGKCTAGDLAAGIGQRQHPAGNGMAGGR